MCVTSVLDKDITLTQKSYRERGQKYEWVIHKKEMQLALYCMKDCSTSPKWKKSEVYWDIILAKPVCLTTILLLAMRRHSLNTNSVKSAQWHIFSLFMPLLGICSQIRCRIFTSISESSLVPILANYLCKQLLFWLLSP